MKFLRERVDEGQEIGMIYTLMEVEEDETDYIFEYDSPLLVIAQNITTDKQGDAIFVRPDPVSNVQSGSANNSAEADNSAEAENSEDTDNSEDAYNGAKGLNSAEAFQQFAELLNAKGAAAPKVKAPSLIERFKFPE